MNFREVAPVVFPQFSGINVNMMPFVIGDPESIPAPLQTYLDLIEACTLPASEIGEVGYLTIDERVVQGGTHRRGGVHTEGFGAMAWGGGGWGGGSGGSWGGGSWGGGARRPSDPEAPSRGNWGSGMGLYMANTIDGSCALYDALIEVSGPGGEITDEQIAGVEMTPTRASTLYWLHDRTPHASLPVSGERQFFRLVSSDVSVWFVDHSTANPLGVEPRGRKIYGSKFA